MSIVTEEDLTVAVRTCPDGILRLHLPWPLPSPTVTSLAEYDDDAFAPPSPRLSTIRASDNADDSGDVWGAALQHLHEAGKRLSIGFRTWSSQAYAAVRRTSQTVGEDCASLAAIAHEHVKTAHEHLKEKRPEDTARDTEPENGVAVAEDTEVGQVRRVRHMTGPELRQMCVQTFNVVREQVMVAKEQLLSQWTERCSAVVRQEPSTGDDVVKHPLQASGVKMSDLYAAATRAVCEGSHNPKDLTTGEDDDDEDTLYLAAQRLSAAQALTA